MKDDKIPSDTAISRAAFPKSRKIHVPGSVHPINVAMREIELHDTNDKFSGKKESNAPITVYDTSGPYTDPLVNINIRKGLEGIRSAWIHGRGDVRELDAISSEYGRARLNDPSLDGIRFKAHRKVLKAAAGKNVSQMHYAKQGIITPEME